MERVAIFIDNSNIYHHIKDLKKIDSDWVSLYNPILLAQKLAGSNKQIVYIGFHCTYPPSYLLTGKPEGKIAFRTQMAYYRAIGQLPEVTMKFGSLQGGRGSLREKNLDTEICTNLTKMASLNEFDMAFIVSNDGDYVSTAETTRNIFDKIVNVAYFKGSLSMDLLRACNGRKRLRRSYFARLNFTI